MANQCNQCGKALSSGSTFCRHCGTLTGVEGAEATVIVRTPQSDGESPWAKLGARYLLPEHNSVQRSGTSHLSPSEVDAVVQARYNQQPWPAPGRKPSPSVIDFVPDQRAVKRDNDRGSESEETRIISQPSGGLSIKGWLVALSGPKAGDSWVIRAGKNLIGRSPGLTVTLNEDAVSSTHASLWIDNEGSVTLVDRDSSNGTFVNGEQICAPVRLSDGDLVRVGESTNLQWVLFHPAVLPANKRLPPAS
jgi:hypothetical protein